MASLPTVIELHISNRCTGNCVVCSKAHGGNKQHFVTDEVMEAVVHRLVEAGGRFKIELGGDGDAFLHPRFLDYCRTLRKNCPQSQLELFTSGFSLTPERANQIIGERLLDSIQIRIDSLDAETYYQSTGMFLDVVLRNIRYFVKHNRYLYFCIIYMPLHQYRETCRRVLGKEPTYFGRITKPLRDEYADVCAFFGQMKQVGKICVRKTGISLWAERTDCQPSDFPCPRLPENKPGDMARQLYIYPNGNYGLCGYDDEQHRFVLGRIFDLKMETVWNGRDMKWTMDFIRQKRRSGCCVNPKACVMWEWEDVQRIKQD